MFKYYENGLEQTFTYRKLYRLFQTVVDKGQKEQGTTFESWLSEMGKMQILIRC